MARLDFSLSRSSPFSKPRAMEHEQIPSISPCSTLRLRSEAITVQGRNMLLANGRPCHVRSAFTGRITWSLARSGGCEAARPHLRACPGEEACQSASGCFVTAWRVGSEVLWPWSRQGRPSVLSDSSWVNTQPWERALKPLIALGPALPA